MLKRNQQTGFTIIEVVLVLAIAGLIFLAVFIALPQLQKSQRDSTRKTDAGRLIAAINQYATNENNGIAPNLEVGVVVNVVGGGYIDDFEYDVVAADLTLTASDEDFGALLEGSGSGNDEALAYLKGVDCDDNPTGGRTFIIVAPQENGPGYCQEG